LRKQRDDALAAATRTEDDVSEPTAQTRARYFQSIVYVDGDPHGRDAGATTLTPSGVAAKLAAEYLERDMAAHAITIKVTLGNEVLDAG
jgi:hypothetical protein